MDAGLDHGAPVRRDRGCRPPLPPLVPAAIARHVKSLTDDGSGPSEDDVREKIMEPCQYAPPGANGCERCSHLPCRKSRVRVPSSALAAIVGELGLDPRRPVGAARVVKDAPDQAGQLAVAYLAGRAATAPPSVVAASAHADNAAQQGGRMRVPSGRSRASILRVSMKPSQLQLQLQVIEGLLIQGSTRSGL